MTACNCPQKHTDHACPRAKSDVMLYSMLCVGYVLSAMAKYRITSADVGYRGTQLKMTLVLDGQQQVIFKPQWYNDFFQYLQLSHGHRHVLKRKGIYRNFKSCCGDIEESYEIMSILWVIIWF